jgi:hypothetical protein
MSLLLYMQKVFLPHGKHLWAFAPCYADTFLYTVDRTPWTGNHPVASLIPAHRTTQAVNKHAQTVVLPMRFEHTIPVFEREKTVARLTFRIVP